MVWYLIFCSGVYSSGEASRVCVSPVVMPSKQACHIVGKEMLATGDPDFRYRTSKYKCVSVKKAL